MSRLSSSNVQVGNTFQVSSMPAQQAEIVTKMVLEAQEEARKLLLAAQSQAKQLLAASTQKAQEIEDEAEARLALACQEAEQAGFNKGYEEGYAQAEQETIRILEGAQTIMDGAYRSKALILKGFKKDAGQIIQFICTRILKKVFLTDPTLLLEMVDEAIQSLHLTGRVRVVVSPDILEHIRQFSDKTEEALDLLSRLELIPDPALQLGEIFILSQEGNFSLAPTKQIKRLIAPIIKNLPIDTTLADQPSPPMTHEAQAVKTPPPPVMEDTIVPVQSQEQESLSEPLPPVSFEALAPEEYPGPQVVDWASTLESFDEEEPSESFLENQD